MERKSSSLIMLALLLTGMLTLAFNIQQAKSSEAPPTQWTRAYGGPEIDYAYSVVQTSDGGYALAGYTESFGAGGANFWLIKTDSAGNALWNKTYGGNDTDIAYFVIKTSDLGYALAGYTYSNVTQNDFWLVKTDSAGTMQWNKTYGGTNQDYAYSVVQTRDGGYALAGTTLSFGAGGVDFYLVKTDSAGTMQWNRTYEGAKNDYAESVVQTSDGGYALAGYTDSFGAGGYDFWLVKTDSDGNMQWNKTYGGKGSDQAHSLVQTRDGGYALAGYAYSSISQNDFWLVKTDSAGTMMWNKTYGGTNQDYAHSLVPTSDGGYALAGYAYSGVGFYDFSSVKADSAGNLRWSKTIGGKGSDLAFSVVQTSDGGYALAGYTTSYGAGNDFWLVKVAAEVHDLAVTNVTLSKTVVGQGYSMSIMVTVENQGNVAETFDVTVYANTTVIGTFTNIILRSRSSTTLTLTWNTAGFAKGKYTISAYANPVPSETDKADNNFVDGRVTVTIVGDVDGDRDVDASDLFALNKAYGSDPSKPSWNPNCDFNNDQSVGVSDLFDLCKNYGKTGP